MKIKNMFLTLLLIMGVTSVIAKDSDKDARTQVALYQLLDAIRDYYKTYKSYLYPEFFDYDIQTAIRQLPVVQKKLYKKQLQELLNVLQETINSAKADKIDFNELDLDAFLRSR